MKNEISVVVFDLGNVLIPFNYDLFLNKLDKKEIGLGKKFAELYEKNYEVHREFEKGKLSEDEYLKTVLKWADYTMTREEFCREFSRIFSVNKKVADLLPVLKENYSLVLLSNTNAIHKKYGWEKYDFLKYFDKLILSHEVGAVKPEEKIYRAVEDFTHKLPSEHIFIDDYGQYAEAASKFGWNAIKFIGYDNLVSELEKRNIILNEVSKAHK